jgi:hypothetical protein
MFKVKIGKLFKPFRNFLRDQNPFSHKFQIQKRNVFLSFSLPTADWGLKIADCRLPTEDCQLRTAD